MEVSIFSFLTALVWSTAFIFITYNVRKINGMKKYYGIGLLAILYSFSIFRIFFPLEFSFTKVIPAEKIYADMFKVLYLDRINGFKSVNIILVLLIIWLVAAVIKIRDFIKEYRNVHKNIMKLSKPCESKELEILDNIKIELNKYIDVNIYKSSYISTPIGIGLFEKSIILMDKPYTDKELYYILLHEYTHFINKDVIVKIMTTFFCYIFWWFPPIQLLKKDLEQVLEIKCDLSVTGDMDKPKKVEYLSVIVSTLKSPKGTQNEVLVGTALVEVKRKAEITERFEAVMDYIPSKKIIIISYVIAILFLLMSVLSYAYIVQPHYEAPEDESIAISTDDAYIVKTKDGKYLFYVNGSFRNELKVETVDVFIEYGYEIIEEK